MYSLEKGKTQILTERSLAERLDVHNGLQDQVTTKLKSLLTDCCGRVRITLAAKISLDLLINLHKVKFQVMNTNLNLVFKDFISKI